jgi:hypothetical protein
LLLASLRPLIADALINSSLNPSPASSSQTIGNIPDSHVLPRKTTIVNAGKPPSRFDWETDISNFMSYASISPAYKSFLASLHSVPVPNSWQTAKQDPRWLCAMQEELQALKKNDIWELVNLPVGKCIVECKWVYTDKQTPEGKVERYNARLVAKGYN